MEISLTEIAYVSAVQYGSRQLPVAMKHLKCMTRELNLYFFDELIKFK